jgi:flagellar motor protein MotB
MAIFLKNKEPENSWMALTDVLVGLFTLFVFAFIALWVKKEYFEDEYVAKNEAFTRKENEFQACVEERQEAQKKLTNYQSLLDKELSGAIQQGLVAVTDGKIDIQASLLFPSAHAQITSDGQGIIKTVARALQSLTDQDTTFMIMVAGYTDNVPISSENYRDNWDLSGARATNVVGNLIQSGLSPDRVFSAGFGEFHPKVPNKTEKNRALNRRVEIVRVPISQNRFEFSGE